MFKKHYLKLLCISYMYVFGVEIKRFSCIESYYTRTMYTPLLVYREVPLAVLACPNTLGTQVSPEQTNCLLQSLKEVLDQDAQVR